MLGYKKIFVQIGIMIFISLLVHVQCCNPCLKNRTKWEKTSLYRQTLTRHHVEMAHVRLLQYYLSEKVILQKKPEPKYNYKNHGLEFWKEHSGRVIFDYLLPGQYVHSSEKWVGSLLRRKKRMYLIIHFEKCHMNLEFIENNDGHFQLLTTKDGYVMFEGEKYNCESGKNALLEIDARQLKDIYEEDRRIKGAKYADEPGWSPGPILIALISLGLVAFLLGNTD